MSVEDIFLSELPESSFSILSYHLDAVNPRRRDWRTLVRKINLDLSEAREVEVSNEHCRRLIEIWTQDGPKVRDLLEILEEMGCDVLMRQLRSDLEQSKLKQTIVPAKNSNKMGGPVNKQLPNQSSNLPSTKPDNPISALESSKDDLLSPVISPPESISNSPGTQPVSVQDLPVPEKLPSAELKSKESPISEERISEARESIKKGFYVSYHQNDAAIGEEIIREMERRNVKVFSTDDILPGDSEIIKREELFKLSRSVIAVITPDYYKEEGFHLLEALFGASGSLFGSKPTLIPIICRTDDDAPTFITSRSSIKWDNPKKFDQLFNGIQKLK